MKLLAGSYAKKASHAGKNKFRLSRIIMLILVFSVVTLLLFSLLSPIPISMLLRSMLSNGVAVAPENYEETEKQVTAIKDLTYPSLYQDNSADIYFPKGGGGPFPVVLWVHGGAFVGGDKRDVEIYATTLASEGLAVICINYQLAPEAKYPAPIIQTEEAYLWTRDMAFKYPFDTERLILAGDSAGAQIVTQFTAIQCNKEYANDMGFKQTVPQGTLKASLLFCGPFDAAKISSSSSSLIGFLMGNAACAYFGSRDWPERFSSQATIASHITSDFPPTFISDGNTASFEDHGRDFADVLRKNKVPVETYFVDPGTEKTNHEYQFVMNTPAGIESFQKTLDFINRYIG